MLKLLPFDFSIVYKAGKENVGADALSRRLHVVDFLHLVVPLLMDFLEFDEALLHDPFIAPIIAALKDNSSSKPGYSLVKQRLYYQGRLVIPRSSPIRTKLLEEAHVTPAGGHGGHLKTLK